ncbi:protein phosphatase CheZ [Pseudaeromonas pectinilytica]|jgi:Chemotaxis protein|nr:protein phosphatase CheZ [Aeromonadaceae bacterium]
MKSKAPLISLEQARMLVMYLEQGEQAAADELLADICAPNASDMFAKIGQLTRQLHTSLHDFQLDSRIPDLAMQEIPDARERLNYVITMTDKAANRTMDAVDAGLPLASQLNERIQQVLPAWKLLMTRQLELGQFKVLCHQLDLFIKQSEIDSNQLRDLLTEILMAQDFQDLTGQMIRRVITLVQEVESKLVEMLTLFGEPLAQQSENPGTINRGIEAEGPIINKETRTDVVASQDDVDDLLSSLGF